MRLLSRAKRDPALISRLCRRRSLPRVHAPLKVPTTVCGCQTSAAVPASRVNVGKKSPTSDGRGLARKERRGATGKDLKPVLVVVGRQSAAVLDETSNSGTRGRRGCRKRVAAFRGCVWAASRAAGRVGTRMQVTQPRRSMRSWFVGVTGRACVRVTVRVRSNGGALGAAHRAAAEATHPPVVLRPAGAWKLAALHEGSKTAHNEAGPGPPCAGGGRVTSATCRREEERRRPMQSVAPPFLCCSLLPAHPASDSRLGLLVFRFLFRPRLPRVHEPSPWPTLCPAASRQQT